MLSVLGMVFSAVTTLQGCPGLPANNSKVYIQAEAFHNRVTEYSIHTIAVAMGDHLYRNVLFHFQLEDLFFAQATHASIAYGQMEFQPCAAVASQNYWPAAFRFFRSRPAPAMDSDAAQIL